MEMLCIPLPDFRRFALVFGQLCEELSGVAGPGRKCGIGENSTRANWNGALPR